MSPSASAGLLSSSASAASGLQAAHAQSQRAMAVVMVLVTCFTLAVIFLDQETIESGTQYHYSASRLGKVVASRIESLETEILPEASDEGLATTAAASTTTTTAATLPSHLLATLREDDELRTPDPRYAIDPEDKEAKYFVYQPSGGWGNQRLILRWAMRAANAMDRILILPKIAPHSMMWQGYDNLTSEETVRAGLVLDLDAMALGVNRGVREYRGHLRQLKKLLPGSWRVWTKPQTRVNAEGRTVVAWMTENAMRAHWRRRTERVVFWNKGSMWMCCAGGEKMTAYIMFTRKLKRAALLLAERLFRGESYNAIHVRRAQGHTRIDRRTARHYIDYHMLPAGMNASTPVYVATDEKNREWFADIAELYPNTLFWEDLMKHSPGNREIVEAALADFPERMRGDVVGFLEQLICANAERWTGSDGSTFTMSIAGMRRYATLRKVDWKAEIERNPRLKRIYGSGGSGDEEVVVETEAGGSGSGEGDEEDSSLDNNN